MTLKITVEVNMPIINGTRVHKKEKIKAEISSETFDKISEYCAWANIDDIGFFIEEAASFIFAKDRDWKQHKKATRKRSEAVDAN
ncbi:hypothetical protein [Legionella micdadei]|nr:hypothetical protein [Legionella micdadei]